MFDWPDMGRLNFGPSASIDELPPRDGASLVVSMKHCRPKPRISDGSVLQLLYDGADDFMFKAELIFVDAIFGGKVEWVHSRQLVVRLRPSQRNNVSKDFVGYMANRLKCNARIGGQIVFPEIWFEEPTIQNAWNWAPEICVCAWDQ